jgi:alpha-glucosidase
MSDQQLWWQRGVIYQVYPRSFMDSNGDGVGDLPGITSRLDYLAWFGVDALWISPIFPSPMADFGYDIADYTDIDPRFGTLADFDALLAAAHARGMKVLLDFVPNHSSDQHPWFVESRASRESPKRDWYIWHDGAPGGGPPNNWLASFGGGAWEYDAPTGQYYYHAFLKQQPDLNWRNPQVQAAMLSVLRFWLGRGVDGFRVDVIWHMIKDDQLRDNPPNPDYKPEQNPYNSLLPLYTTDRSEVHQIIRMLRRVFDEYDERVLIGEIYLPIKGLVSYYGGDLPECHLPFNFQLIELPWQARTITAAIDSYEAALPPGGWPNWVLGNHDQHRIATRTSAAQARVAAMLLLTLRGTPTIYYGDELGMHNVVIPPELAQDPQELNLPGLGLGRDPQRTPMQWDAEANAGFTTDAPWLPITGDYQTNNVAAERVDPRSMLALYRRLIGLRRAEPALHDGAYQPVLADGDLLAYVRVAGEQRFLIALNLGSATANLALGELGGVQVVLSTHLDREGEAVHGTLALRGDEGVVVELS